MATPVRPRFATYEQYLAFERASDTKHEFVGGEIFAMAGGRYEHNRIAANVIAMLTAALRGKPCVANTSDMRVRAPDGTAHYPDVSAFCGEPRFSDERRDELLNPSAVVEVLSDSTEAYDRGDKFAHYATIASLRDYVLVSSSRERVDHFVREGDGWKLRSFGPGESLSLSSLPCSLAVDELYDKVFSPRGS